MSHTDNKLPTKDAGLDQLKQGVEKAKKEFDRSREEAAPKRGPGRPPGGGKKGR